MKCKTTERLQTIAAAEPRDGVNGTLLQYVNTIFRKISFFSLAQSAYSGIHVALPLHLWSSHSLPVLREAQIRAMQNCHHRKEGGWSDLYSFFLDWRKTESGSAPTWLKTSLRFSTSCCTTTKESLCTSFIVFLCSNEIPGSNASPRSCTKVKFMSCNFSKNTCTWDPLTKSVEIWDVNGSDGTKSQVLIWSTTKSVCFCSELKAGGEGSHLLQSAFLRRFSVFLSWLYFKTVEKLSA